jgi:transcriptional regulator with XRE-family HTH domain
MRLANIRGLVSQRPSLAQPFSNSLKIQQIRSLTSNAICDIYIAICYMKLGEKIRYLREVEGSLRGMGRPMTQQEIVRAVRQELGKSISQSYLSQIEGGSRPHMTQSSRALLARFFKVHPGFLVDDPEGYHTELTSDLRTTEGQLDVWLLQGSERFASDPEVSEVLIKAAREKDTRRCLLLLGAILETPGLADRLLEALRPELMANDNRRRPVASEGRRIR